MGDTGEPSICPNEPLSKPPEKKKSANVTWSEAEDAKLVEVLLEEQANGQQVESGWKKAVWTKVIQALHEESPGSKNKTADKAKTRFDRVSGLLSYIIVFCRSHFKTAQGRVQGCQELA